MRIQAYLFCGYYEHGRVKSPPPDPDIVDVYIYTNGDVGCHSPTLAQYRAFLKRCYRACQHITSGVAIESRVNRYRNRKQIPSRSQVRSAIESGRLTCAEGFGGIFWEGTMLPKVSRKSWAALHSWAGHPPLP